MKFVDWECKVESGPRLFWFPLSCTEESSLCSSNRALMNGHRFLWMMPSAAEGHNAQVLNWAQTGWQQMVLCLAGSPGLQSRLDISQYERTCEQALLECRSWWSAIKRQGHERLVNTGSCSCWALVDKWSTQRAHSSTPFHPLTCSPTMSS